MTDRTSVPSDAWLPPAGTMGIYTITCIPDDRVYVGSSDNIRRRWVKHRSLLRGGQHHNYLLQAAWTALGEGSFVFAMAEVITDVDLIIPAEQRHLDAAKRAGETFNLATDIVNPGRGRVHSEVARRKMSDSIRASLTPERRQAKSKRVRGEQNPSGKLTEAVVLDVVRRLLAGEHPAEVGALLGVTEATIYQIRSGRLWASVVTPEQVAAMMAIRQNGWKKRVVTDEHRARFSEVGRSNKGKSPSAERREQVSRQSRGDGNPKAKLTADQIPEIRRLIAACTCYRDLGPIAAKFGVSVNAIHRIKTGEAWTHVPFDDAVPHPPEPAAEPGQVAFPIT